jgi:hypothetical protein
MRQAIHSRKVHVMRTGNTVATESAALISAALVMLLAGCSALSSGAAPSTPPAVVSSDSSPETRDSTCPDPNGGTCLGPLAAGEYHTTTFRTQLSYTVPDGWTNMEDLPGNFWLYLQEDEAGQSTPRGGSFLGIYSNIHAAAIDCREDWQDGVGTTPTELVDWYRSVPGLAVSDPVEVSVGGLSGLQIDVALREGTCTFEDVPGTPLIMGSGVSELHHGIGERMGVRLIILEWGGAGNITLEITNVDEQHTAAEFRAQVQPIIDSLVFTP